MPGVRDEPHMTLPDIIPVFPLPNVVLFPQIVLPLHIFEPRYREMVRDAARGPRLIGIDRHVRLEVGSDARIAGVFEGGQHTDEKLSTVQYVRFPLDPTLRARVATGAPLTLVVDHPNYRARAPLPELVRASLAADLADPAVADRALREVRDGR